MDREEFEKLFIDTDMGVFAPQYDTEYFNKTGLYKVTKDAKTCYIEEKKRREAEDNNKEKIQATEEQQLLSTVLLENAEIKEQLKEQQELSANLALQTAELKGGNANVQVG